MINFMVKSVFLKNKKDNVSLRDISVRQQLLTAEIAENAEFFKRNVKIFFKISCRELACLFRYDKVAIHEKYQFIRSAY